MQRFPLRGDQVVSSLPFAFPAPILPLHGGEERCAVTCGLPECFGSGHEHTVGLPLPSVSVEHSEPESHNGLGWKGQLKTI